MLLLALIWPAQLLTAAGVVTGTTSPAIAQAFATTQVVWFGLAYTLVSTLLTPAVCRLGDIFGKKRIMMIAAGIGLVGDLIVVLGPSFEMVLLGRALAGFYGPIGALVFATARDVFPPRRVGVASSLIGSSLGLTTLLAPLVVGVLLDNFGFRGPLWFVVVGTAIALVLLTVLPETPRRAPTARFDWLGSLLLGTATVALVFGVDRGGSWGWSSAPVLGLGVVTVACLIGFVVVERRHAEPVVDVRMLRRRAVATVLTSTSVLQGTVYAVAVVATLLTLFPPIPGVSAGLGWSGTKTALVMATGQLAMFLLGFVVGKMSGRWDPRRPWLVGSVITTLGLVSYAFLHGNAWQIGLSALVVGIGGGFSVGSVPLLILGSVSPKEQSMANGMSVLLTGVATAVVSTVIFAVMAASGVVMDGTQFYSDASFRNAYLVCAAILAASIPVTLAIPRILKTSEIESGQAAS
ncbi:MFS transporter [Isoptericola hypogeus]|uniref:MFS transporter n=1 Tax=Isoptericola hypogeus TaxID=300179 RepID=UPI0031DF2A3E